MISVMNVIRIILIIPLFIALLATLLIAPYLISFKYTIFNSSYIKNIATDSRMVEIVEASIFKQSSNDNTQQLQEQIFKDKSFITGAISSGIDSIFVWLDRSSEEINVTANKEETQQKYLTILYSKMQEEIFKEFGKDIDPSKIHVCKDANLSIEELRIRFINGSPCFPMDLEQAADNAFNDIGLKSDNDKVVILSVPKEKLSDLNSIRDIYWIIENSEALTIGILLTLISLIVLISPKKTSGYILTGVSIFIISTTNYAFLSSIPYLEIDEILKYLNIKRDDITKETLDVVYNQIFSRIIEDVANIGKRASLYLLILSIIIITSYITYKVVKKRKEIINPTETKEIVSKN